MKKDVIFEIFSFLKQKGIASSKNEFSQEWLGQCESYFRGLRFKKTEPSMGAVAICGSRLLKAGNEMIARPRYRLLGEQFIAMSEKCRALVDADGVEFDLA